MATITLSPPTEEEIERNLSGQRPLTSMDIGKGTPTGTTPEMKGFTAEAENSLLVDKILQELMQV